MNGIQFFVSPPKPVVKQGRIVRLIDHTPSQPTGRPSKAHPRATVNARWYQENKERILEQQKKYREAKREFINRRKREKRAAEKAAREHAKVRGVLPSGEKLP